jgi:hypothetical protein
MSARIDEMSACNAFFVPAPFLHCALAESPIFALIRAGRGAILARSSSSSLFFLLLLAAAAAVVAAAARARRRAPRRSRKAARARRLAAQQLAQLLIQVAKLRLAIALIHARIIIAFFVIGITECSAHRRFVRLGVKVLVESVHGEGQRSGARNRADLRQL